MFGAMEVEGGMGMGQPSKRVCHRPPGMKCRGTIHGAQGPLEHPARSEGQRLLKDDQWTIITPLADLFAIHWPGGRLLQGWCSVCSMDACTAVGAWLIPLLPPCIGQPPFIHRGYCCHGPGCHVALCYEVPQESGRAPGHHLVFLAGHTLWVGWLQLDL